MHAWLAFVARNRLLEIALAVGLGSAALAVADNASKTATSVLAQHIGRDTSGGDTDVPRLVDLFSAPYHLYFKVGSTFVVYGGVLSALLTLGLLGLVTWVVVRRRNQALGECPFCASRIPHGSKHCAYCGSAVAPGNT